MILPILPYGNPILKAKALEINKSYPKLKDLIKNEINLFVLQVSNGEAII